MSTELTTTISASLATYKNKHEKALAEFTETHGKLVYNLTQEEERKKARAARREVNSAIKALDDEHAEIKAPFLEATRTIDATRKAIKDKFLILSDGIGDQLKAHDSMIQEKLDHISIQADVDQGSVKQIQQVIEYVQSIEIDDSFCDKKPDAALLKEQSLQKLASLKKAAEDREELERLKKAEAERQAKEREERIAREAAEQAQKAAEEKAKAELARAEREKAEAIAAAERAAKQAEEEKARAAREAEERQAAAVKAEQDRIAREQKQAAEKAEAERKANEAKKAKQEHRAKIHKQAKESLMANGLDETVSIAIVELIRDGKIKNVTINY